MGSECYQSWLADRKAEYQEIKLMMPNLKSMVEKFWMSERFKVLELLLEGKTLKNKLPSLGPPTYPVAEIATMPKQHRLSVEMRVIFSYLLMQLVDLHKKDQHCGLICQETIVAWQKNDNDPYSWKVQLVPDFLPSKQALRDDDFLQLSTMMRDIVRPGPIPLDVRHLLDHLESPRSIPNLTLISHHPCTWGVYDNVINTMVLSKFVVENDISHPDDCLFENFLPFAMQVDIFVRALDSYKRDGGCLQNMTLLSLLMMTYDDAVYFI
ncbi:hypothetical protein Tsubulata_044865 [Turnera subulata]|uniref:Uncharacterized protein n=1 Tax=Turnera subulata TaxID=218843 RepID=A0A9Q0GKB5_9ROSI|nr:hypothetical protein Tsubulata_044865 [Turnera subulata]